MSEREDALKDLKIELEYIQKQIAITKNKPDNVDKKRDLQRLIEIKRGLYRDLVELEEL